MLKSLARLGAGSYKATPEYQKLTRVLSEEAQYGEDGSIKPKNTTEIGSDSLQNPSDPDATFRRKAGEGHKGYVGTFVETMDENGAIITQFCYKQNIHSDSAFSQEVVAELGVQEETVTVLSDGAYGGEANVEKGRENKNQFTESRLTSERINLSFDTQTIQSTCKLT